MNHLKFLVCLITVTLFSCIDDETFGSISSSKCRDTNCADYNSRSEAQADYDWNSECRADLDADKDGLACEENNWIDYYNSKNPGSGGSSGCPTTSNCGCSGINKSPCENERCCKWVTGSGCRCR